MKNKILLIVLIFFLIFCFAIFLKSLNTSSIYVPEKSEKRELPEFVATELFSDKEITSNEIFKDSDTTVAWATLQKYVIVSMVNVSTLYCLFCLLYLCLFFSII